MWYLYFLFFHSTLFVAENIFEQFLWKVLLMELRECVCVFVAKHFISTDLEHVNVVKNIANFIMQINKLFMFLVAQFLASLRKDRSLRAILLKTHT